MERECNAPHNLRGQLPMPKPDAAIPRQVDAVSHFSLLRVEYHNFDLLL
jgi:hypothetical protein